MLCYENSTAVLIMEESMSHKYQFLFDISMISFLSMAMRGLVCRHMAHLVCCSKTAFTFRNLSMLSPVISPKHLSSSAKCSCYLHHVSAHDDGKLIMRTFLIYGKLYIGKIDNMQLYPARISGNLLCKVYNLLLCSLLRIWRLHGNMWH